jgi:hypothetical protein
VFYEVRDITDPQNESRFELELDQPPLPGDALELGSMAYEVIHVQQAVISVVRPVGPGESGRA